MSDTDILAAALRYAAAGVAVFPTRIGIRGDGKKDVRPIGSWKEASTTDPAVIASWWGPSGAWNGAALCIDCGKSGIVGVDQDITEGKQGIVEWEKLAPAPTWRVRSGSGGAHDYYRADPDHPVTVDNDGTVADGVDVRGVGGFLFAPPSVDPRGGDWSWVDGEPDWEKLPGVPRVVIERIEAKQSARRRPKQSAPAPAPVEFSEPNAEMSGFMADLLGLAASAPDIDYGPAGGRKTRSAALELMQRERATFLAMTEEGSARSHHLSQRYGPIAGHGVDVFWTYEHAFESLLQDCRDNGFADANGESYAEGQIERGLEYGMATPWIDDTPAPPTEALEQAIAVTAPDAIDALLAEMLDPSEIISRPPPRYLIHDLLQFDSESWIIGPPGSKKSFVVLDMAAAVLRGRPWQGFDTHPADVVMIVAEGAGGMGKRLKAWELRHGPMPAGMRILPRPVQAGMPERWSVLVGACARLADAAKGAGRGLLVVLDTQARVTVGMKENDATDMGVFIDAISAIRERTGACVLTVHHTGRTGGDARGSSAIDGAQTSELKVMPKGKLAARLSAEKQKDIEEIDGVDLAFEVVVVGQDDKGRDVTSLVLAEPGSDAFRAAYAGAETTHEDVEAEAHARVTPFKYRAAVDGWIVGMGDPKAELQHWIVQALVDTAETLGLTQSEVKGIVEEKRGQVDKTTFRRAWQKVTEDQGTWSSVVTDAGGQRWTVDRVSISSLNQVATDG